MAEIINVLIVDDQDLMLQGLSMLVGKEEDLHVVGTCHDGQEAVEFCKSNNPDVVLMDIRMPVLNGVEATKRILENNDSIKIIILTTFMDDDYIFTSLRLGASGYLLKDAKPDEITNAIRKVYAGGTLINPDVATTLVKAIRETKDDDIVNSDSNLKVSTSNKSDSNKSDSDDKINELTKREIDICHYLAEGKNNREIGEVLVISEGTVKNNITRILDKLALRDRTQLALYALKHQL